MTHGVVIGSKELAALAHAVMAYKSVLQIIGELDHSAIANPEADTLAHAWAVLQRHEHGVCDCPVVMEGSAR